MSDPRSANLSPEYERALAFWYGRINYEQRSPQPDDLKLDHMRGLLDRLGNPERRLRILHVAGSKGKGSTSAILASILRHAGFRTGLFTSPHLSRVEERVQVDGQPISRRELTQLLSDIREVEEARSGRPQSTFFEVATALGFLHFVRRRVDAAVVEVGLGGRFDSTNVCDPRVSIVTSISFDHTQLLGNSLAAIAREKAGIIKTGRPAISGALAEEARQVIAAIARARGSPLRQLGRDFAYEHRPGQVTQEGGSRAQARITVRGRMRPWLELGLLGDHQAANAAVAVAAIEELRDQGWHIPDRAVAQGLANVDWPARLEVVGRKPILVLDCAHNTASAQALVDALLASFPKTRRWLVFAASSDKDVPGMFRILAPHFHHAFLARYANSARGCPPELLAEQWRSSADLPYTVCASAAEALALARSQAVETDLICVTGSVFLSGELRPLLRNETGS